MINKLFGNVTKSSMGGAICIGGFIGWYLTVKFICEKSLEIYGTSSLYAVTDELHQLFVSDRAGRVTDWLIDSAGAVIFLCIGWLILRTIDNKKSYSKG